LFRTNRAVLCTPGTAGDIGVRFPFEKLSSTPTAAGSPLTPQPSASRASSPAKRAFPPAASPPQELPSAISTRLASPQVNATSSVRPSRSELTSPSSRSRRLQSASQLAIPSTSTTSPTHRASIFLATPSVWALATFRYPTIQPNPTRPISPINTSLSARATIRVWVRLPILSVAHATSRCRSTSSTNNLVSSKIGAGPKGPAPTLSHLVGPKTPNSKSHTTQSLHHFPGTTDS
jgi:hypothetical protein